MGEPETPHFHDFDIIERVPGSQTNLSLEAPRHFKKSEKNIEAFSRNIQLEILKFHNSKTLTILKIMDMGATSTREHVIEIL